MKIITKKTLTHVILLSTIFFYKAYSTENNIDESVLMDECRNYGLNDKFDQAKVEYIAKNYAAYKNTSQYVKNESFVYAILQENEDEALKLLADGAHINPVQAGSGFYGTLIHTLCHLYSSREHLGFYLYFIKKARNSEIINPEQYSAILHNPNWLGQTPLYYLLTGPGGNYIHLPHIEVLIKYGVNLNRPICTKRYGTIEYFANWYLPNHRCFPVLQLFVNNGYNMNALISYHNGSTRTYETGTFLDIINEFIDDFKCRLYKNYPNEKPSEAGEEYLKFLKDNKNWIINNGGKTFFDLPKNTDVITENSSE